MNKVIVNGGDCMNGKKFSWLPVLIISIIVQHLIGIAILYVEVRTFPQLMMIILSYFHFLPISIIGGFIANHYLHQTFIRHWWNKRCNIRN